MPLTGFSMARFKEHLRKCAPFYIVGIIVMLFLTNLVYTMTRPVTPAEKEVLIYLVDPLSDAEALKPLAEEALAYGKTIDDTLEEVRFESIPYNNPEQDYQSAYLLVTRLAVGDGDIYFCVDYAAEQMVANEVCMPLDDALADGWLSGYEGAPYMAEDPETGKTFTAGVSLEPLAGVLEGEGIFRATGAQMVVANNSTNVETSMAVAEFVLRRMSEEGFTTRSASTEGN